jgi:hypothetical protein
MPTYEYECNPEKEGCGHKFEIVHKLNDKPLKKCPKCKASKLKKVLNAPAVIFNGTGWTPKSSSGQV